MNIRDDEGQQQQHPLYSTFGTIPNQRVVEDDPNNSTMMNAIDGPLILKKTHKDAVKMVSSSPKKENPCTSLQEENEQNEGKKVEFSFSSFFFLVNLFIFFFVKYQLV